MTLVAFIRLCQFWKKHPPTRELLHAFMRGFEEKSPSQPPTPGATPPAAAARVSAAAHRADLEKRWQSGNYLSPAALFAGAEGDTKELKIG